MATGKKKVIVYTDWIIQFKDLTDEEAGKLIKHFFEYVNDLNPKGDRLTELLFNPIKATLKRDLVSWELKQNINRQNGLKGGRPKKETETENNPNNPVGFFETQNNPKKGVSDSVNVSVNVSDNVNVNINNSLDSRKLKFANTLKPFVVVYGRDLIKQFYEYWTEPNQSKTKFRKELQKTWDTKRRLENWVKNDSKFNTKNNGTKEIRTIDDVATEVRNRTIAKFEEQQRAFEEANGISTQYTGFGFEDTQFTEVD